MYIRCIQVNYFRINDFVMKFLQIIICAYMLRGETIFSHAGSTVFSMDACSLLLPTSSQDWTPHVSYMCIHMYMYMYMDRHMDLFIVR